MHTRDDQVVTVYYPDGTTVVEHADGTRITTVKQQVAVTDVDSSHCGNRHVMFSSNLCQEELVILSASISHTLHAKV